MTGWQAGLLGSSFVVGTVIQGLCVLNFSSYSPQSWHGTLIVWAIVALCVGFNVGFAKKLPGIEALFLIVHFLGLFVVCAPLWAMAPRSNARDALLTFSNEGGWASNSISALIGLLTPMNALLGFDCIVHMCRHSTLPPTDNISKLIAYSAEESEDASRITARSMMWSYGFNAALGLIAAVTICFCTGDVSEIIDTPTKYPFIQLFYNVTQSHVATSCMATIMIVPLCSCAITEVSTSSRQLWSFARDKGIPGSAWVAKVSPS